MSGSEWKERIGRLPVLGNLLVGARGLWSLRAWRAQLRAEVAALAGRTGAVERRVDSLEARQDQFEQAVATLRVADGAQARLDAIARRQERDALRLHEQARRVETLASTVRQSVAQVRQIAVHQRFAQGASAPAEGPPPAAAVAVIDLAALIDEQGLRLPAEACALLAAQATPEARAARLPDVDPEGWAAGLRAQAPASLAAVIAERGAGALGRARFDELLDAAAAALRPHGVLVLDFANPEQADVAAQLVAQAAGGTVWTAALVERHLRATGYVEVRVVRHGQDEAARLPGEGEAIARLNRWLCGPRRYAVCAQRAA